MIYTKKQVLENLEAANQELEYAKKNDNYLDEDNLMVIQSKQAYFERLNEEIHINKLEEIEG